MLRWAWLLLLLLALLQSGCGQDESCTATNLCTQSYCTTCFKDCEATSSRPLVNGTEIVAGLLIKTFEKKKDYCDCCQPTFVPYISEGEPCFTDTANYDLQYKGICGPGLACSRDGSVCRPIDSDCTRAQRRYNEMVESGQLGMDMGMPECDEDGYWASVQCSFTGVCRCVDKMTGDPIFGMAENLAAARQSDMDCACSREMEVLKEMSCGMLVHYNGNSDINFARFQEEYVACMAGSDSYWPGHLRCLPNGNFDPAQCHHQMLEDDWPHTVEEECYCLNTTDMSVNSSLVTVSLATTVLPCHTPVPDLYYEKYYRPCEKAKMEMRTLAGEADSKGAIFASGGWLGECTPDGFYALVQRNKSNPTQGYCSDRLGNQIENFYGDYDDMDCLCAQVWRYTNSLDYRPKCTEDGSFEGAQCRFSRCYCVDEFGRQLGLEVDYLEFDPTTCTPII